MNSVAAASINVPDNVPRERVVDFDIFDPFSEELHDYHRAWLGLRESSEFDIVWTPHNEGHWIVLAPQLVTEVLSDASRFSSRIVLVPKSTIGEAYGYFIPLSLDPPAHGPFRKVLNEKLLGAKINPLEEGIRHLAKGLIEDFCGKGQCNFVLEFAEKFPLHVFMQLVDLPLEDLPTLKHLADQFTRPDGSIESGDVIKAFHAYLAPIMAQRKGSGRSDVLTHIAESSVNGRPITDMEATNLASQVNGRGTRYCGQFSELHDVDAGHTPGSAEKDRRESRRCHQRYQRIAAPLANCIFSARSDCRCEGRRYDPTSGRHGRCADAALRTQR